MGATTPRTAFKKGEKRPGQGKRGPGKVTKALKDMILGALDDAGGQEYLRQCAMDPKTRSAYLTLLGKVLPTEQRLANPDGSPLQALSVAPTFNVTLSTTESPKR